MSSTSEPVHLNNHHRNTLRQLFQHPVGHNIEWHAVISLLEAVGSVVEHHDGVVAVTVGSKTEFFDPPAKKDIDIQAVVDLRRMLSAAGYGARTGEAQAGEARAGEAHAGEAHAGEAQTGEAQTGEAETSGQQD